MSSTDEVLLLAGLRILAAQLNLRRLEAGLARWGLHDGVLAAPDGVLILILVGHGATSFIVDLVQRVLKKHSRLGTNTI